MGARRPESSSIGSRGEQLVAAYLRSRGWTVLHRNFRGGSKEIDLVMLRDGVVAFVEVRTRSRVDYGHPFDTIGRRKQEAIRMAAKAWVAAHGSSDYSYRFDAASVLTQSGRPAIIEYLEDAWT